MVVLEKENISILAVLQKVLLSLEPFLEERSPTLQDPGRKATLIRFGQHLLNLPMPPLSCSLVKGLHYQTIVFEVEAS